MRYDDRILGLPTQPLEVTPLDDRRLVVDAFARWRIVDLVRVPRRPSARVAMHAAQSRLDRIVQRRDPRGAGLGAVSSGCCQKTAPALMNQIRDIARREAAALGVDVIDVRLTRTDLPEQNLERHLCADAGRT